MFEELDVVRLKRDIGGVAKGTRGTIVYVLSNADGKYIVEFDGPSVYEPVLLDPVNQDDLEASEP